MKTALRRDAPVWAGLVLLLVGLALMDRSFALWRNDQRNIPDADGRYHPEAKHTHSAFLESHTTLSTMFLSGLTLVIVSGVLLWKGAERSSV